MLNKTVSFLLFIFFLPSQLYAQSPDLKKLEDSLAVIGPLVIRGESDSIRESNALIFQSLMKQTLELPGAYEYTFSKLETASILKSPDNRFRLITWVVIKRDQTAYNYYGFLQAKDPKSGKVSLHELVDSTDNIINPEYLKLRPDNWYGAIYYEIIPTGRKKSKQYTLLGWKGVSNKITSKVIDVLKFQGTKPVFGSSLFEGTKPARSRVVFKYTQQAVMSLKYHASSKEIVFDNLSPSDQNLKGKYEFYGPDFSYNAFKWKKNKWQYLSDFTAKNPKSGEGKKVKVRNEPGLLPPPKK